MSYLDDFFDRRKAAREALAALTPEQQQAEKQRTLVEQRQKAIDYKRFFGEAAHKNVMLDLMDRYHVLSPIDDPDPCRAAYLNGQRSVVLDILKRAHLTVEQLDRMMKGDFV